jgi:hypothetical protein
MKLKSFSDLIELLDTLKNNNNLIFRGQSDKDWDVVPKSGRKGYSEKYTNTLSEELVFKSWKRYAKFHLTKYPENNWDWLAIAQHHGLATRLLDWTKNPLVGAYFACFENFQNDGVIYYYALKDIVDFDEKETDPFKMKGFNVFFPSGFASRIINQRGLFTITDKPKIDLKKQLKSKLKQIIIPKEIKIEILRSLDFYGINKMSLYNDLDSLSSYLNEYVMNFHKKIKDSLDIIIIDE